MFENTFNNLPLDPEWAINPIYYWIIEHKHDDEIIFPNDVSLGEEHLLEILREKNMVYKQIDKYMKRKMELLKQIYELDEFINENKRVLHDLVKTENEAMKELIEKNNQNMNFIVHQEWFKKDK